MKLALLTLALLAVLVLSVPAASPRTKVVCTSGTSSISPTGETTTIWYPPGCAHP